MLSALLLATGSMPQLGHLGHLTAAPRLKTTLSAGSTTSCRLALQAAAASMFMAQQQQQHQQHMAAAMMQQGFGLPTGMPILPAYQQAAMYQQAYQRAASASASASAQTAVANAAAAAAAGADGRSGTGTNSGSVQLPPPQLSPQLQQQPQQQQAGRDGSSTPGNGAGQPGTHHGSNELPASAHASVPRSHSGELLPPQQSPAIDPPARSQSDDFGHGRLYRPTASHAQPARALSSLSLFSAASGSLTADQGTCEPAECAAGAGSSPRPGSSAASEHEAGSGDGTPVCCVLEACCSDLLVRVGSCQRSSSQATIMHAWTRRLAMNSVLDVMQDTKSVRCGQHFEPSMATNVSKGSSGRSSGDLYRLTARLSDSSPAAGGSMFTCSDAEGGGSRSGSGGASARRETPLITAPVPAVKGAVAPAPPGHSAFSPTVEAALEAAAAMQRERH